MLTDKYHIMSWMKSIAWALCFILLIAGCAVGTTPVTPAASTATVTPESVPEVPPEDTPLPVIIAPLATAEEESEEQIVSTPTPEPTATPGFIEDAVSDIASATGLDRRVVLGLTGEDWVNLAISLSIVLLGIFVIGRLVFLSLLALARSLPGSRGESFLHKIKNQIRWFVGIMIVQYATGRLIFLPAEWKQSLNQLYFTLYVATAAVILWKLIDSALTWYQERVEAEPGGKVSSNIFLPLLKRVFHGLLVVIAATVVLNNYGINVTALIAVLGIGGLALTLAAQDTLSDMINGFLILLDQPFRVGDRIWVQDLDTWGDVVEVGTRTTRIRTRDNRLVIMPNSSISKSQVVNYSFPDPSLRSEIEIGIAYGADPDDLERVLVETISKIEGVLAEQPIRVLLFELNDAAMKFHVRWWNESYLDTNLVYDRVNRAILTALDRADIPLALKTYDVNLKLGSENITGSVKDHHDDLETE